MKALTSAIALATLLTLSSAASAFDMPAPATAQLPIPGVVFDPANTAVLITDPQNDFLSEEGVAWSMVGENVTANNTIENIESLFETAKDAGFQVFISPHYYYPTDHGWHFEGALERVMHNLGMFDRSGSLSLDGFEGSGADWLARYKPFIEDGETVVSSPHKLYGPENNDVMLQMRKRGISRVILGGMSANLCIEAHMRELLERGFEVAVVVDATAAAVIPDGDGYAAAVTNFRFMANEVLTTNEAVERMRRVARPR